MIDLAKIKTRLICLMVFFSAAVSAKTVVDDQMSTRVFNFSTFPEASTQITIDHERYTSEEAKQHPEYGKLPLYTQCRDCIELIDRRELKSRFYIKPGSAAKHFFVQNSWFNLHYEDDLGDLRTIDPRLKPAATDGFHYAMGQPVPTACKKSLGTSKIRSDNLWLEYNSKPQVFHRDFFGGTSSPIDADFSQRTVGAQGAKTKQAWKDIDIESIHQTSGIKTNYILKSPPQTLAYEWMVFRDEFNIPEGLTIRFPNQQNELHEPTHTDIQFADLDGDIRFVIHRAKYYDSHGLGMAGFYQAEQVGKTLILDTYVPHAWLNDPDLTYPVTIDPFVSGRDSLGFFINAPGAVGAGLSFTESSQGSCDYDLTMTVPGKSELFDTWVDLEYEVSDSLCVQSPPAPSPFCEFFDLTMEIVSPCNVSTGQLVCNPAAPPFLGTCTTDPDKVPGAGAILIQNFAPTFVDCIAPQCDDYTLTYTLKNRSLQCSEVCGHNCAIGSFFAVTQEARTIEGFITANPTTVCAGSPVILSAFPEFGVPPYSYDWSGPAGPYPDSSVIVVFPEESSFYSCRMWDVCDSLFADDNVLITVIPSPTADAGDDIIVCQGGNVTVGGNPTNSAGSNASWQVIPASASALFSNPAAANPTFSIPQGTIDTFTLIVTTDDQTCTRSDTMQIFSIDNPVPTIIPDTTLAICEGDTVTLSTIQSYQSYSWSNGSTNAQIGVTTAGNYSVTVSQGDCSGSSQNTVQILTKPELIFSVEPDTQIDFGDSVRLTSTINWADSLIDTFFWQPAVNISCLDCESPIVFPLQDQVYTLSIAQSGCTSTQEVEIRVVQPDEYFIPNVFTPNGDATNEDFYIFHAPGLEVREFRVFNRWGEKVHDAPAPWNGVYKNKIVQPGVYAYYMELVLFTGERILEKGSVTVVW